MVGLKSLLRWLRHEGGFAPVRDVPRPRPVKTSLSATVFTGDAGPWVEYLTASRADRYDPTLQIDITVDPAAEAVQFRGANDTSAVLARHLQTAWQTLYKRLRRKPVVHRSLQQAVFANASNHGGPLALRLSRSLPCDASREVPLSTSARPAAVHLVVRESLVQQVIENLAQAGKHLPAEEHLGWCWPLLHRVVSQLSFPNVPRDRFVEKIDVTFTACLVTLHALYDGKRQQQLLPNAAGRVFETSVARRDGLAVEELYERHEYFRLLRELAFLLDERACTQRAAFARVLVREYLDESYLRLSLAGVMPEVEASMDRMPFHWDRHSITTPYPRLGRYGILDEDDLSAWKKVESRFRDMGFVLLRQLGIGQFGRVYEALNRYNPHIPRHVAVKIDRIVRGKKKEAIQSAEATMGIGEALATAPHVIRIFDAGKLKGKRYTYHILQLVDGETLDHLVGVSGIEHSSMLPPRHGQRSTKEVQQDYLKSVKASSQEIWRRKRMARPFLEPLNLAQMLDVLTSILLWLEEIHQLNYAVNDLKNGNLMVSRRGQLKGIDLDAYSPITSPTDRMTDFFFLAVSLVLFLLNVARPQDQPLRGCTGLLQSPAALRDAVTHAWSFGDVAAASAGRVTTEEVLDLMLELIDRSRDHAFANDPALFTRDIDRLILLKRRIFATEIVLD
ncbi:MAG: hypothetical protein MUF48_04450 [Pirellulaceae bacterium]|jgi:hypothetical protein|nr:hypothetical protein [Pirellulaceae bacterium]